MSATQQCVCGCGRETSRDFAEGCDQSARTRLIELKYGTTVQFLEHHGYGRGGRNLHKESEDFRLLGTTKAQRPPSASVAR